MNLDYSKILYLSTHDVDKDPGVEKKIQGICNSARKKGFSVERITKYCRSISERKDLLREALISESGIIFIRSFSNLTIAFTGQIMKARHQGRIVICDQPSPLSTSLNEIWHSKASIVKKLYSTIWGIASGPWSIRCYSRIIEYAPEGCYYRIGNHKRIKLLGNGIDVTRIQLRNHMIRTNDDIHLVGVANTSIQHGFDRMIKAIAEFNQKHPFKVYFKIIGGSESSPVIKSLKELTNVLQIKEYVSFVGFQNQEYISRSYDESDLAVGALGLFRVGLSTSSILKIREYALAGIPFITAGKDPDFSEDVPFRFEVSNDESLDSILLVLERFHECRRKFTDDDIRQYAIENFSFDKKFDQIMEGLL